MAPKKKKAYKRSPSGGNPSTTLITFLVIFILGNIGTGIMAYYGYQDKAKAEAKAKQELADAAAAKQKAEFMHGIALEAREAMGAPLKKDADLDEQNLRDIFLQDLQGGKYAGEKLLPLVEKMAEINKQNLGWNGRGYTSTYPAKFKELEAKIVELQQEKAKLVEQNTALSKQYQDLETKYQPIFAAARKEIKDAQDKALTEAKQRSEEFKNLDAAYVKLDAAFEDFKQKSAEEVRKLERINTGLLAKLEKKEVVDPRIGVQPQAGGDQPHALVLDVSKGRPLWDQPKGKIIRLERNDRNAIVAINIGRAAGARPELTFNVFGAGEDGRPYGLLKGTVEIINVLDDTTSLAQVTSLFNREGYEIPLYDLKKGASVRMADNPLEEGDLLFNTFWNTRVALAGKFSLSGAKSANVAEDLREMKQFIQVLQSMNIQVDAFLDLTDGEIKGEIRPDTRFLIVGPNVREDEQPLEGDPKIATGKVINAKIAEMRQKAVENGMFIISFTNFLNVAGYRRPQGALSTEVGDFRPTLPAAGRPRGDRQ